MTNTEIYWSIYNSGWNDGVDGVLCENPYTDSDERAAYEAGRRDGARYYREHENDDVTY
jgi:hypothetical protein